MTHPGASVRTAAAVQRCCAFGRRAPVKMTPSGRQRVTQLLAAGAGAPAGRHRASQVASLVDPAEVDRPVEGMRARVQVVGGDPRAVSPLGSDSALLIPYAAAVRRDRPEADTEPPVRPLTGVVRPGQDHTTVSAPPSTATPRPLPQVPRSLHGGAWQQTWAGSEAKSRSMLRTLYWVPARRVFLAGRTPPAMI